MFNPVCLTNAGQDRRLTSLLMIIILLMSSVLPHIILTTLLSHMHLLSKTKKMKHRSVNCKLSCMDIKHGLLVYRNSINYKCFKTSPLENIWIYERKKLSGNLGLLHRGIFWFMQVISPSSVRILKLKLWWSGYLAWLWGEPQETKSKILTGLLLEKQPFGKPRTFGE